MVTPEELAKFRTLEVEFEAYSRRLQAEWLRENRPRLRNVLEVMDRHERVQVDGCIARWIRYITPIAEAWWRAQGWKVVWPEDNSQPAQYYKLEDAQNVARVEDPCDTGGEP